MNIGEVSKLTELPAKTLRYYEEIGLISPARAENGYRNFSEAQVQTLRFLSRARSHGFSIGECRSLIGLYEDHSRKSEDVRKITLDHIAAIDTKIMELQTIRDTLSGLAAACSGDARPDCPILKELSGRTSTAK